MVKSKSPVTHASDGTCAWLSMPGDTYLVVGRTVNGRRFRQVHSSWWWARGINLYNGRKYLVRDGKRYLIASVRN